MSEFPSYRPIQQFVVDNLNLKKDQLYTSRLNAWIRVTSNAGGGLTLQSNPNLPLVGESSVYGNADEPGVVGLDWGNKPVKVAGADRGFRPPPIVEGLSVKNGTFGLTRELNFSINCYTPGQLDVIQQYFGEPGFTCVVEYGWDLARSLNQKIGLNAKNISDLMNFDKVLAKRKSSEGDYDNFLGFITGFKIGSNGDVYTADVTLKGLGELPETMKIQKPITESSGGKGGEKKQPKPDTWKIGEIDDEEDAGRKNCMQMHNSLPGHKQTFTVKSLINLPSFAGEENFINFNEDTKTKLQDETEGGAGWNDVSTSEGRLSIPKGTKLVGNERYIRFKTFKKIMDTNELVKTEVGMSVGPSSFPYKVYTEFTLCSAFDRIFSTRKDKLLVPNERTPDFGFIKILQGEDQTFEAGKNPCGQRDASGNIAVQFPEDGAAPVYTSNGFKSPSRNSRTWGYLDNLYVNFDFACSVLEAENITYSDAILSILNGMSSAVNSMWNFQIMEKALPQAIDGHPKGKSVLQVVEMNLNDHGKKSAMNLVHNGEGSFFLDGTLDIDLPAEMMSSIIADRNKAASGGDPDFNAEQNETMGKGPISNTTLQDSVLKIINDNATKNVKNPAKDDASNPPEEEGSEEDAIAAMYNQFLDKIGSFPRFKVGKFNVDVGGLQEGLAGLGNLFRSQQNKVISITLEQALFFPTYNDQGLFKGFLNEDNPDFADNNKTSLKGSGAIIGGMKYSFKIHGNSGISHGDTFNVIGIPSRYRQNGFFQVTNITHTVNGMVWETEVEGTFRAGG